MQGEAVGFETEATAIMDTMAYIRPDIYTLVRLRLCLSLRPADQPAMVCFCRHAVCSRRWQQ